MTIPRKRILSICLSPNVVKALDHYIKALSVGPRAIHSVLGRSTVINSILHRELKRHGLDPDNLQLLGGKR